MERTIQIVLKSGHVHEITFHAGRIKSAMSDLIEGLTSDNIRSFAAQDDDGPVLVIMYSEIAMISVCNKVST